MSVIGYYVTCDDAVCEEDFDGWTEETIAIQADDSRDTPTHCVECGCLLEHDLTDDGYDYVLEHLTQAITNGERTPVETMWRLHYARLAQWEESQQALIERFDALPLTIHPAHAKHAQRLAEMES